MAVALGRRRHHRRLTEEFIYVKKIYSSPEANVYKMSYVSHSCKRSIPKVYVADMSEGELVVGMEIHV